MADAKNAANPSASLQAVRTRIDAIDADLFRQIEITEV